MKRIITTALAAIAFATCASAQHMDIRNEISWRVHDIIRSTANTISWRIQSKADEEIRGAIYGEPWYCPVCHTRQDGGYCTQCGTRRCDGHGRRWTCSSCRRTSNGDYCRHCGAPSPETAVRLERQTRQRAETAKTRLEEINPKSE